VQIGQGSIIYVGDVNNETETMQVMIVLLGLAPVPEEEIQNRPVMPVSVCTTAQIAIYLIAIHRLA
jgi:hypothetical protein